MISGLAQTKPKNMKSTKPVSNVIFLRGKKGVTMRPIQESDALLFTRWINGPRVRKYLKGTFPFTESFELEWIRSTSKPSNTSVHLVIEVRGRPIGVMGVHNIIWQSGTAITGAFIGEPRYWGKGYGTAAKMALLDYAFNTLNLRKIISKVKAFNERSIAYSKKCGYKIEGRLVEQHFVDGKYWDEVILGVFRNDWLALWRKYKSK
jgi:RimJ/RimL family protein N-acetyltransferase